MNPSGRSFRTERGKCQIRAKKYFWLYPCKIKDEAKEKIISICFDLESIKVSGKDSKQLAIRKQSFPVGPMVFLICMILYTGKRIKNNVWFDLSMEAHNFSMLMLLLDLWCHQLNTYYFSSLIGIVTLKERPAVVFHIKQI